MSANEVVDCALRSMNGKRVVVIPGLRFKILGRLSQMPLFQPIVQRLTGAPRSVPTEPVVPVQPVEPRMEPVLSMQQEAEMAG